MLSAVRDCDVINSELRLIATVRQASRRRGGPGPSGGEAKIAGLTEARPGLAQAALAMARVLDNPRAVSNQPAAKVLAALLDKLRAPARGRRGGLALVRSMAEKGGGALAD